MSDEIPEDYYISGYNFNEDMSKKIKVDHSPAGYGMAYMKQNFPNEPVVIITANNVVSNLTIEDSVAMILSALATTTSSDGNKAKTADI